MLIERYKPRREHTPARISGHYDLEVGGDSFCGHNQVTFCSLLPLCAHPLFDTPHMLKIWKGKWKQETGNNSLQVDNMGDADGGVSSLADSTSSAPSTSRLHCDNLPAPVQESERPLKRRKTKHQARADIGKISVSHPLARKIQSGS